MWSPSMAPMAAAGMSSESLRLPLAASTPPAITMVSAGTIGKKASIAATQRIAAYVQGELDTRSVNDSNIHRKYRLWSLMAEPVPCEMAAARYAEIMADDDALAAQEFEEWVREAIDSLPSGIADAVSNVEVLMRTPIRRIQSAWACTRASP